jgi:hypothetical protein
METGRGPFGIRSLASLSVQLATIGGPPPLPGRDSCRSSIATSVVYCDVTERNRIAMSRHRNNVASRHYDGLRRCCYSGIN